MSTENKPREIIIAADALEPEQAELIQKQENESTGKRLVKYLIDTIDDHRYKQSQAVFKGFDYDPQKPSAYEGLYRRRDNLLPYFTIKQLALNDDLLGIILQTRGHQLSNFGHIQVDRHKIGYKISYRSNKVLQLSPEKRQELNKRIELCRDKLYWCGRTDGLQENQKKTLPQFLKEAARAALLVGFVPVEIVKDRAGEFHHFRTLDFGTIYRTPLIQKSQEAQDSLKRAYQELMKLQTKNESGVQINWDAMDYRRFIEGEYTWVQVTNNIPCMAFTDQELLCHFYYPANELEWNGYPLGPIETVCQDCTSHMNANTFNRQYWKSGRGARGFLTIQSDDINEHELARIRTQFYASINNVTNAHRMPLFGVGKDDKIQFQPFEQNNRDQEFMYLSDNLSRVILAAFGMDPAELPGFGNLSRGTFSQALAESSNEYALQVSRSAGFKPLLYETQVMMNKLMAIMDPLVAEYCIFEFAGLDASDVNKESTLLQQNLNVYLTMNDVNKVVEKDPAIIGGNIPLNPMYQNTIREHYSEAMLQYAFTGNKDVLYDPLLGFYNNGFFFQYLSLFPELMKSKGRVAEALKTYTAQIIELIDKK